MPSHNSNGRRQGVLADWNDDRGFGFIAPLGGSPRLFVHVSAFPRGVRPVLGCHVSYAEVHDDRGRARAAAVQYVGTAPHRRPRGHRQVQATIVAATFFAGLLDLVLLDDLPVTLTLAYGVLSLIAFGLYGEDKEAAEQHRWRTPESALHLVAVLGGWPGALVGRHHFCHKTRKQPFRTIFWMTVLANCAALGWFIHETPVTLP